MSKPTEDRQWIYQRSQHIPHTQAETIMKMFYFKADARKMLHLTQKDSEFLLYLHTVWWYCWRWSQFCIHSGTSPSGWHNRGRRTHCLHDTHLHLWREGEKLHLDSLGWRHSEKETQFWIEKEYQFILTTPTFATCAVLSEMIASSTGDCVPATGVGAYCVDTRLPKRAWSCIGHALIYI